LVLGPGPDHIRQRLFETVSKNEPPFKRSFKAIGKMYSRVYSRNILTKNSYLEKTSEDIKTEISRRWDEFIEHELPKLDSVLSHDIAYFNEKYN
jgi:hypothetical protein